MEEESVFDGEEGIKIPPVTETTESPAIEFARTEKPWWVRIKQIVRLEDGTVYGLGSDSNMYNWHHSFAHSGKWVLLVTGR